MKVQNVLAQSIEMTEGKAALDAVCKKLLANKSILARILKGCVEEYRECSLRDIEEKYIEGEPKVARTTVHRDTRIKDERKLIELGTKERAYRELIRGIGNEDSSVEEGTVTYDVIFEALNPLTRNELITMIVNIECQNDFNPGYPLVKRGIYYGGRMLSSQYGIVFTESHYEKLEKVYSIWICVNPPKYRQNSINMYAFSEKQLVGNVREKKENYDLITVCMLCLGEEEDTNCRGILRLLTVLLSDKMKADEKKRILEEEFEIEMTRQLESEVAEMCNYSDGIERKGIARGIEQGILQSLQNLLESTEMSIDQAMKALKIPENECENYKAKLKLEK